MKDRPPSFRDIAPDQELLDDRDAGVGDEHPTMFIDFLIGYRHVCSVVQHLHPKDLVIDQFVQSREPHDPPLIRRQLFDSSTFQPKSLVCRTFDLRKID